jgi:hypothetical protein
VRSGVISVGRLVVAASLLAGCGGMTGGAGGGDAASTNDVTSVGADANVGFDAQLDAACLATCPAQEPTAGTPCTTDCAYTADAGSGCTRVYSCLSGQYQSGGMQCLAPLGEGCPGTAAGIDAGGACDPGAAPCEYPGTVCQCAYSYALVDASYEWFCITIPPDCPPTAPLLGSACSPSDQECAYGANMCAARGFGFFRCLCGAWTEIGPLPCK